MVWLRRSSKGKFWMYVTMKNEASDMELVQNYRGECLDGCGLCCLALPRQAQDKMLLCHMQKKGGGVSGDTCRD